MTTNFMKTLKRNLFRMFKIYRNGQNSLTTAVNSSSESIISRPKASGNQISTVSETCESALNPSSTKKKNKKGTKESTETDKICQFLEEHYVFRYNLLTEQTEFRIKVKNMQSFALLGEREMNTICIEAQKAGLQCWDRDLARYIHSSFITAYHPFTLYLSKLPVWDGQNRLTDLAERVSDNDQWVRYFHRWMLAVVAQWMGVNDTHANSMAPLLISSTQGLQKSTFCKSLLPEPLQFYYTDQLDLAASGMENKLAQMGLINLDEFDRLSPSRMAQLKNWMQMPSLSIRKAYKKHFSQLPRIASFIGTSNRKDLLTDPTGSRRFLCIEVQHAIDCSNINHAQIYAQLKTELQQGERYWFSTEDEKEIQAHNAAFYQSSPEEELFRAHFRAAAKDEEGELLSLADIIETLRTFHRGILRSLNLAKFGSALVASGVERLHTHTGNRYRVVRIGEGCEG